jgi:hypothetical protein
MITGVNREKDGVDTSKMGYFTLEGSCEETNSQDVPFYDIFKPDLSSSWTGIVDKEGK